jgi:hypothetical protein
VSTFDLARHLHFLRYYLEQNQIEKCRQDIKNICRLDVPKLEQAVRAEVGSEDQHDPEFIEKIGPLLRDQHLDSAIRRAFVILKERLVKRFELNQNLDGSELVNAVFGKTGVLAGRIPEWEQRGMRDLLNGLYGMFRNPYGHRDIDPGWFEAAAVLGLIDWVLKKIDTLPAS